MKRQLIPAGIGRYSNLFGGLTLFLLLTVVGCDNYAPSAQVAPSPHLAATISVSPHNHVPQSSSQYFLVYVTFTQETTYEQAERALSEKGIYHYPMVNAVPCGNLERFGLTPQTGTPCPIGTQMPPEELRTDFSQSHRMLASSSSWEMLNQLATNSRVVSIDPYPR